MQMIRLESCRTVQSEPFLNNSPAKKKDEIYVYIFGYSCGGHFGLTFLCVKRLLVRCEVAFMHAVSLLMLREMEGLDTTRWGSLPSNTHLYILTFFKKKNII